METVMATGKKVAQLFEGHDLFVAFELNFTNPLDEDVAALSLKLEKVCASFVYRREECYTRIYMPAVTIENPMRTVVFPAKLFSRAAFARLMFSRPHKTRKKRKIAARMTCARFGEGETSCFGFTFDEATNGKKEEGENKKRSTHHLPLRFPGISGYFNPLYVKMWSEERRAMVYIKVEAKKHEANEVVLVRAIPEAPKEAPPHLRAYRL